MLKLKGSQSSGCHTFTKQAKKFKQTSSSQKADGNCFLGQKRIAAPRDHSNIISVLQNTKITAYVHLEQKVWNADI
jgi:hypothetical protein